VILHFIKFDSQISVKQVYLNLLIKVKNTKKKNKNKNTPKKPQENLNPPKFPLSDSIEPFGQFKLWLFALSLEVKTPPL